jgi:hypothetical protein
MEQDFTQVFICTQPLCVNELSPWSRVVLEKLIVAQLFKKFIAFHGTPRFITVFTRAHHWALF